MFDKDNRDLYYDLSKDLYTYGVIKDNDMNEIMRIIDTQKIVNLK